MPERIRIAFALAAGLLFAALLTPGANATVGPAGSIDVALSKDSRKDLRKAGVTVAAEAGETRPRLRIGVSGGQVTKVAQAELEGGIVFASKPGKRERTAKARDLAAIIAPGRSQVTGRIGGAYMTVLVLRGTPENPFDPLTGEVGFDGARASLTNRAVGALRDRLRSPRLRAELGTGAMRATLEPAPVTVDEAPVRPRPATAVDVTSAELTWRARTSWVDYLHAAGAQGGAVGKDGAVDGPAEVIPPSNDARVYQWDFPFADGWYDPVSGEATVSFDGAVNYFKLVDPFDIDLDATAPEVELGGAEPRMISVLNGREGNSDQQNRRAVVVDLDQDAVTPEVTGDGGGTTYTYDEIPGLSPAGTIAWPIAAFYQPGDAWGSVSISFTVPEQAP